MTDKRLLASLFFLFALSAAYLFSVNERGLDPDQNKNWWSLAFSQPEDEQSLAFVIANHTPESRFQYVVRSETETLATGELSIDPGQRLEYQPSLADPLPTGRITITVSHAGQNETIYRSL